MTSFLLTSDELQQLIHLRDQLLALERIAGLTKRSFISVEAYDPIVNLVPFPVARYRADRERAVVFWEPGAKTWRRMIHAAGFADVREVRRFKLQATEGWNVHHVVHAATK